MVENVNIAESVHSIGRSSASGPAVNSEVCKKLIGLTDDAYCTVRLYQGIFLYEPVLVAGVLRLANAQGLKKPVLTLIEATSMLGWKKLRGIVSAICLSGVNKTTNSTLGLVWELSSLRIIIAKLLAASKSEQVKEKVEQCSYVLNLGRFQLASNEQEKYSEVIELVRAGCNLNEAEQAKFGFIANSVSSKLCKSLRMPEFFSNLIDDYMLCKNKDEAFEILAQAELLSVTMLYQQQELDKVSARLNVNNFDRFLNTTIKEFQALKKLSGF